MMTLGEDCGGGASQWHPWEWLLHREGRVQGRQRGKPHAPQLPHVQTVILQVSYQSSNKMRCNSADCTATLYFKSILYGCFCCADLESLKWITEARLAMTEREMQLLDTRTLTSLILRRPSLASTGWSGFTGGQFVSFYANWHKLPLLAEWRNQTSLIDQG